MVIQFPLRKICGGALQVIVVDRDLLRIEWVRRALIATGLKIVSTGVEGTGFNSLRILPQQSLALVVIGFPPVAGLKAVAHVLNRSAELRQLAPFVPIAFVSESGRPLSDDALPFCVHVLTEQRADFARILSQGMAIRREQCWEARNTEPSFLSAKPTSHPRRALEAWKSQYTTANFNVKHPSMVVPFAVASALAGREVFCEVSAQEIAVYHGISTGDPVDKAMANALSSLRQDVDSLNRSLGARLRIHLDHCDDLELLRAACDAGFDSVMADGSGRTLEQNIGFTRAASRIVRPYGIPIEGEVGSVDGGGRWSKTRIDDFDRYVSATEVDFIGVSIGQFHGFDYGFDATRSRLSKIEAVDGEPISRDRRAALHACLYVQEKLRERQLSHHSPEHRIVQLIAQRIMSSETTRTSLDVIFDEHRALAPMHIRYLIDDLEDAWLSRRKDVVRQKIDLWHSIFSLHRNVGEQHGLIDHALLHQLIERLADRPTQVVIHGGSSIARNDLASLPRNRVARVNFGTDLFHDYVSALGEEMPGVPVSATSDYPQLMAYLSQATSNWRRWMECPPHWMTSYAQSLVSTYVDPLVEERSQTKEVSHGSV